VLAGGLVGAHLGSHRLGNKPLLIVLGGVLLMAGGKMLLV